MFADRTEQTTAQVLYLVFSQVGICYEICSDPEDTFACHFLLFIKGDSEDVYIYFCQYCLLYQFLCYLCLKT